MAAAAAAPSGAPRTPSSPARSAAAPTRRGARRSATSRSRGRCKAPSTPAATSRTSRSNSATAPPAAAAAGAAAATSRGGGLLALQNGNLLFEELADGRHRLTRVSDGALLVTLEAATFGAPLPLHTLPSLSATFGLGGATVFGLGQFREACYPEGGSQTPPLGRVFAAGALTTLDLARGEGGAANSLPWLAGATVGAGADWGVWLNVPAMGQLALDSRDDANRSATWSLAAAAQLDYVVTTTPAGGTPEASFFDVLQNFVSWTGAAPAPPEWTLGYWHSKCRYASQAELLAAAHGFANRSVPVDIIIIDWLHWRVQGDWSFDADSWPDPTAMVAELATLGMRTMVTVWPWSHNGSLTYDAMLEQGLFVRAINGTATPGAGDCPAGELCPPGVVTMPDGLHGSLVDVTNPAARDFVWGKILEGYVRHGIELFWLDSTEPELFNFPQWGQVHWQNATFGNGTFAEGGTFAEMGMMFTLYWTQMFADGVRALGAPPVLLPRASYAGTQRHGAALWSGDIHCTWPVLQTQVRTGLSAQTSGFGLFTTDIGGYTDDGVSKCDPSNATYVELWVRWFQMGVLSPIFRQHGARETEIWLYGPEAETIVAELIRWRASMRGYIAQEMQKLSATGRPLNRQLWWDFPTDVTSWTIDDEYMFGDDYLAAPVLTAGATSRNVYLPPGRWRHVFSGQDYAGGASYLVPAPITSFPLFLRGV